jgi:hypothetical protein
MNSGYPEEGGICVTAVLYFIHTAAFIQHGLVLRPLVLRLFGFNAPSLFTPFYDLRSRIFNLTFFGWFICVY